MKARTQKSLRIVKIEVMRIVTTKNGFHFCNWTEMYCAAYAHLM